MPPTAQSTIAMTRLRLERLNYCEISAGLNKKVLISTLL